MIDLTVFCTHSDNCTVLKKYVKKIRLFFIFDWPYFTAVIQNNKESQHANKAEV